MAAHPLDFKSPDRPATPETDGPNRGSQADDTHWWKTYARHGCIDGQPPPKNDAPDDHEPSPPAQPCPV